jgi:uncharacterized membrane protein YvlD (DUF360 family)
MSNTSTPTGDCAGFEGNPDLYGLGIRTGVYLQWYSSWLSISVEPRTAAETHTANTVFMFAIVVAVLRSIRSGNIRPVEAWLMLQICLGYVFTVVSIFGLRLQLLRPRQWEAVMATASRRFATALEKFKSKKTNNTWPSVDLRSLFLKSPQKSPLSNHEARKIRLSELAYFKDTSLSWTGSLWRTVTISLVMATNLWLLIRGVDTMPSKGACGGYGYIFIFSRQAIDKTTRIILAVFGVLFTLPLAAILLGLFWTVLNLIFTCIVSWAIAISDPERETTGEFISLYAKFIGLLPDIISIIPVRGTLLGGIIATSRALQKGSNIGAGVLLRTYASISIASARIEQERTYERPHNNKK